MKDYYYYDGYVYFAKIISEAAHYDIVVIVVYCIVFNIMWNSLARMGFLDTPITCTYKPMHKQLYPG